MTKLRKTALAFGAACALAFTGGATALKTIPAVADATVTGNGYYGKTLKNPFAIAFYNELVAMNQDPDGTGPNLSEFRTGATHAISDRSVISNEEVAKYENGDPTLVKQFGAAVDCFRYDYPEVFWVDFSRLAFTATKPAPTPPQTPPQTREGEEVGGGGSGESGGGSGGSVTEPTTPAEYTLTIGAGRAASYFLYDLTAEQLNDAGGIYSKYETEKTELMGKINEKISAKGATTLKDKVTAVNEFFRRGEEDPRFNYGFDNYNEGTMKELNYYVDTAASIIKLTASSPGSKTTSAGLSRVFKVVMNALGVECEIVSGYMFENKAVKPWTWNYVKDGGDWYAMDVASNLSKNEYTYLTDEIFSIDHFEDNVVSLSDYKMEYPALKVIPYGVATGNLQVSEGTIDLPASGGTMETKEAIVVSYKADGKTLKFREKSEGGAWGEWTSFDDCMRDFGYNFAAQPAPQEETNDETSGGGEGGSGNEGTGGETPAAPPVYKIALKDERYYLFGLKAGAFEIGVFDGSGVPVESLDKAKDPFVPVALVSNDDVRLTAQPVQEIELRIICSKDLEKIEKTAAVEIEYSVFAPFGTEWKELTGNDLDLVKQNSTVKEVHFNDSNMVTFKFTPSGLLEHSGLRYSFRVTNLKEKGSTILVRPQEYDVVFKRSNVNASGVYKGSSLYLDLVTRPSLVFNNDISLSDWTYGENKKVLDNMLPTLALSVSKPVSYVSNDLTNAAKKVVKESNVLTKQVTSESTSWAAGENYILDLTLDGKSVNIPASKYLKLAFPYPQGYGPDQNKLDDSGVIYKVLRFKKNPQAPTNIHEDETALNKMYEYDKPEIFDAVALWQGIVVAVEGDVSSAYVLAVLHYKDVSINERRHGMILTETTGVGGTITPDKGGAVKTITNIEAGSWTDCYTITPATGYKIAFVRLNGKEIALDKETSTYKFIPKNYMVIEEGTGTTGTINAVLWVEFVKDDAAENAATVESAFAENFVKTYRLSSAEYSDEQTAAIVRDYSTGGAIHLLAVKPKTASSLMQTIILLGALGVFALIGAIVIIYCGAIRPKVLRERQEEAERVAANRERKANRNRTLSSGSPRDHNLRR